MDKDNMEEKQKYLRQNILESGYDPNDFVSFLEHNQNIDHIDIQGWSMKKIQQLVTAYRQYKYYTSKQQNYAVKQDVNTLKQQSQPQSEKKKIFSERQRKTASKIIEQERSKGSDKSIPSLQLLSDQGGKFIYQKQKMSYYQELKNKIQYPRYAPLFDYEFKAKCKCLKQDTQINQELKVEIPKFQLVQTSGLFLGFGSKTQIWYTVKSNIKKQTVVKRLLGDFDWLSSTIIRLYPYLALPELPEYRKEVQNSFQKRRIQVQEYLQVLVTRKQLFHSNILNDFLTVHHQKIQKIKKSYDGIGFSKGVGLLKNIQGQVEVEYNKRLREFEENCHQYSKKTLPIHEKFAESICKTVESLQVVVTNINFLVDYFAELHQNYNELMNKFPEHKSSEYNEVLVNMNNLFLGISENIKGHAVNMQKHLKDYFKINVLNDKNIIRLQRYIKQEEKVYLDYKYNLLRKKQRVINEPQKWDIGLKNLTNDQIVNLKSDKQKLFQIILPRQTQQQNQIKCWIAYLYSHFVDQFKTYIKQSTWRYAFKYKTLTTDLLNNDKNYLQSLTKFLTQSRRLVK